MDVIPTGAFYQNKSLKTIDLSHVVEIKPFAFQETVSLNDVDLSNVEIVGDNAFRNGSLTLLSLPKAKVIGELAFYSNFLRELSIPVVEHIKGYAFTNTKLEVIELPQALTKLDPTAFYSNSYLKKYTCNGSENYDGNSWLINNGVLYRLNEDKTTYTLESYPVKKDDKEYTILDKTTRIQEYAFDNNELIEKVVIPASVTRIGDGAFYNTKKLTHYTFLGNAPVLESYYSANLVQYFNGLQEIPESLKNTLWKYSYWNVFYFYCNFYEYIGVTNTNSEDAPMELTIVYNEDATGFDNLIWETFFKNRPEKKQKAVEHVITIYNVDGTVLSTFKAEENKTLASVLETPSKEGYRFVKWLDSNGNEIDLENTKLTKDLKLTAVFEEIIEEPTSPNNSNALIITLIAVISSLVVIGGGGGTFFFIKARKKKQA